MDVGSSFILILLLIAVLLVVVSVAAVAAVAACCCLDGAAAAAATAAAARSDEPNAIIRSLFSFLHSHLCCHPGFTCSPVTCIFLVPVNERSLALSFPTFIRVN